MEKRTIKESVERSAEKKTIERLMIINVSPDDPDYIYYKTKIKKEYCVDMVLKILNRLVARTRQTEKYDNERNKADIKRLKAYTEILARCENILEEEEETEDYIELWE